jgi:hypothetical protein
MSKSYVSPKVIFAKCGDMWIFGSNQSTHNCRFKNNCENRLEQLYLCGNCKDNYIEKSYIEYLMYTDGVVPVCGVCTNQNSSTLKYKQRLKKLLK